MLEMICGKLTEENHDPSNVQVVATKTEKGQQLSLEDLNGVFLIVPVQRSLGHHHQFQLWC